jgi:hypothetical protein
MLVSIVVKQVPTFCPSTMNTAALHGIMPVTAIDCKIPIDAPLL